MVPTDVEDGDFKIEVLGKTSMSISCSRFPGMTGLVLARGYK